LNLNQLYANIDTQNIGSLKLFTNFDFQKIGVKKQWNLVNGIYKDEALFQLIHQIN
jgi:diamine N-acetyltransferase